MSKFLPLALALITLLPALADSSPAFGEEPIETTTLFSISKNENKNQVIYAVHVSGKCTPVGDSPVFAYWLMREKGPGVTEPLLGIEQPAYGIAEEQVLERNDDGGRVRVTLRAVPSRPIDVSLQLLDGRCNALSVMPVAGEPAYLFNVHAKVWPFGVESLMVSGWAFDRTRVLRETLHP